VGAFSPLPKTNLGPTATPSWHSHSAFATPSSPLLVVDGPPRFFFPPGSPWCSKNNPPTSRSWKRLVVTIPQGVLSLSRRFCSLPPWPLAELPEGNAIAVRARPYPINAPILIPPPTHSPSHAAPPPRKSRPPPPHDIGPFPSYFTSTPSFSSQPFLCMYD